MAAIKQMRHKVIKKPLRVRYFGATYISVPFLSNIRTFLKRGQHNVASSKSCALDQL